VKKRNITIIICITIILIFILLVSGIIPKLIGKQIAIKYVEDNYKDMNLKYNYIEYSSAYGDYIVNFIDNNNKIYNFRLNSKYFPTAIEYDSIIQSVVSNNTKNNSANTIEPYIPDGVETSNGNDEQIWINMDYYNRRPENVTIEVLEDTITNETVEILITDNNEDYYAWGEEFRIQKKENGNWQEVPVKTEGMTFKSIAWIPNKDNQLKMKIDYGKYYGKLETGIYRVVKTIYDGTYIELYSNEFEIK